MSFVGLFTGLSGLRAAQTGIDVASHNVANANTPGYTRQRVELAARPAYRSPVGQIGTGVDVVAIARLRDSFLDARFRAAVGDEKAATVRGSLLATLEDLSGEPEQGITLRLGRLWDTAEAWANDPADIASRRQVLNELGAVSDGIRATAAAWETLGADTEARRDTVVDTINRTLEAIHDLDRRIANADPSRVGPELFDQRDRLLDEIASLTGATVRIGSDDRSEIVLGGQQLMSAAEPATLAVSGTDITVSPPGGGAAVAVTPGGELGGLHRFLTQDLPEWQAALDAVATALIDEINAVNGAGFTADGQPGGVLLAAGDPARVAATIGVITTDPAALAASTDAGGSPAPHDASNARRFADLRTTSFVAPGGPTVDARTEDLVVGLAGEVRASRLAAGAARSVATGAAMARAAQHGVSLDEEMVDLVRYQRALEASARVMTTVDEMLEVLVNRVGIVGR